MASSSRPTSRTTRTTRDGTPTVRRRSPQVSHRGEGSNPVLPPSQQALDPPVPPSPVPKSSEDAAQSGANTAFERVNARTDLMADEKLDAMLQMHGDDQRRRAADEARERVFGPRNAETPGKTRSRSPSTREPNISSTDWVYDSRPGRRTPSSTSPSFREYERQRSLVQRRERWSEHTHPNTWYPHAGELNSKFQTIPPYTRPTGRHRSAQRSRVRRRLPRRQR